MYSVHKKERAIRLAQSLSNGGYPILWGAYFTGDFHVLDSEFTGTTCDFDTLITNLCHLSGNSQKYFVVLDQLGIPNGQPLFVQKTKCAPVGLVGCVDEAQALQGRSRPVNSSILWTSWITAQGVGRIGGLSFQNECVISSSALMASHE